MKKKLISLFLLSSLSLLGCSGSGDGSNNGRGDAPDGQLTLSITDAAVDGATEVWIQFSAIEIKPATGSSITHTFNTPVNINLLSLQGSLSQDFFNNTVVPSGTYEWVRLMVNAKVDPNTGFSPSYILMNDGPHDLTIPSGDQTGLKISQPFTVGANAQTAVTIDFDLRKSIVEAGGKYILKPVLRLVENEKSGSINGSISASSALLVSGDCPDTDPATGNAVYIFIGHDAETDDIDKQSPDPITTALMNLNVTTGEYDYEVGFLPEGTYTVAYTCMANLDDPEKDDLILFQQTTNVTVFSAATLSAAESNR